MNRKDLICSLLEGVETGAPESSAARDEAGSPRHDPPPPAGGNGRAVMGGRLAGPEPGATVVRVFEDGDFVFAHTTHDSATPRVAMEVFRFEGDQVVEHWANLQPRQGPNPSGHSMVDGQTRLLELEKTESNRDIIQAFVAEVLIGRQGEKIYDYVKWNHFVEHNPRGSDDLDALIAIVTGVGQDGGPSVRYERCQRVLAEGNFVLSLCTGRVNQTPASFYDLWCLEHDYVVEHWDTTQTIPPR